MSLQKKIQSSNDGLQAHFLSGVYGTNTLGSLNVFSGIYTLRSENLHFILYMVKILCNEVLKIQDRRQRLLTYLIFFCLDTINMKEKRAISSHI